MEWLIAFIILYDAGYTERRLTEQRFISKYECMKMALSAEYKKSIIYYYQGKNIREVFIHCIQDRHNVANDRGAQI